MRVLALLVVAVSSHYACGEERLNGTWRTVAHQSDGICQIGEPEGGLRLRFADDQVTWLKADPKDVSIPLHGSKLDCRVDESSNPKRMALSFDEFGKEVWAYCIYDVNEDTLMIRMLLTIGLSQEDVSDATRRRFMEDPYPANFVSVSGDSALLLILRRENEQPVVKGEQ